MELRSRIFTALGLLLAVACPSLAGVLHGTAQEIALWQQRRTAPAYAADWRRIQDRADGFRRQPSAERWAGNQLAVAWDAVAVKRGGQDVNDHPGRDRGEGLRDAGFVYLLTGDTSYRAAVRTALLTQVAQSGTVFRNPAKWDPDAVALDHNNFEIVNWLRRLAYGYSYIRASLSGSEQSTIDTWFRQAATYWDGVLDNQIQARFPQRHNDEYATPRAPFNPGKGNGLTHQGGYPVYKFHSCWENIPATTNAFVAVVGALLQDATLKAHATRFVKEWLMFAVAPDGTVQDQFRWNTTSNDPAGTGYMYAGTVIGSIVATVDHLARAGDPALYDYTTSAGLYGWGGGAKNLRLVLRRYAQMTLGERGMPNGMQVRAAGAVMGPGTRYITDLWMLPAQRQMQEPLLTQVFRRALPSSPASGGYDPWGGDWGTYPSVRFMFQDMPGGSLPSGGHITPSAPRNLRILQ